MAVYHHVGAGDWTWALCKNSKCFVTSDLLSSPGHLSYMCFLASRLRVGWELDAAAEGWHPTRTSSSSTLMSEAGLLVWPPRTLWHYPESPPVIPLALLLLIKNSVKVFLKDWSPGKCFLHMTSLVHRNSQQLWLPEGIKAAMTPAWLRLELRLKVLPLAEELTSPGPGWGAVGSWWLLRGSWREYVRSECDWGMLCTHRKCTGIKKSKTKQTKIMGCLEQNSWQLFLFLSYNQV